MVAKRQRGQQRLAQEVFPLEPVVPPVSSGRDLPQPSQPAGEGQVTERPQSRKADAANTETGGLYIISVAARMLEMHPQTLRKYERVGLISPPRTEGMLRLYSQQDIVRLRLIKHLVDKLGVNLAGVEVLLSMISHLQETVEHIQALQMEGETKATVERDLEEMLQVLNIAFEDLLEQ